MTASANWRVFGVFGLALVAAVACAAPSEQPPISLSTTPTASSRSEQTKPPGIDTTQPQLPLVTSVRWAVDGRSTGPLLVLLYQGYASSFRVVDPSGATVAQFGIAGSGIFGPESCVGRRDPGENVTWAGVDPSTLDSFMERYSTYRVVASGIPTGQVTLPITDSGCRGTS